MKNRGALFILLAVFVLFISGCINSDNSDGTNIGGADIYFLYNNDQPPTDSIYEGDDVTVAYYLVNNIQYPITNALACVEDSPADNYGGIQGKDCQSVSLPAATEYDGELIPYKSEPIFVQGEPYKNIEQGVDDTIIWITLSYSLKTNSFANMCLIKDPNTYDGPFPCPSDFSLSGVENSIRNDFAPLIVEKIEGRNRKQGEQNKLILDIYFRKSPVGELYDPTNNKPRFSVNIGFNTLKSVFTCNPVSEDNKIEMSGTGFDDLSKKITCTSVLDLSENPEEHSLQIDLEYSYKTIIQRGPIKLEAIG